MATHFAALGLALIGASFLLGFVLEFSGHRHSEKMGRLIRALRQR